MSKWLLCYFNCEEFSKVNNPPAMLFVFGSETVWICRVSLYNGKATCNGELIRLLPPVHDQDGFELIIIIGACVLIRQI